MIAESPHRTPALGSLLRFLRASKGISARGLSDLAGLSPSYISKVEAGLEPSLKAFARIAEVLSLSVYEIHFLMRVAAERSHESTSEHDENMEQVPFTGPSQ